jgi:hypothetical protein
VFPSFVSIKTLCALFAYLTQTMCPSHLFPLDFVILITTEEYTILSYSLCSSFQLPVNFLPPKSKVPPQLADLEHHQHGHFCVSTTRVKVSRPHRPDKSRNKTILTVSNQITNSVTPEPESSPPRSQQPASGPYPEPGESTPHPPTNLPKVHLIPSSHLRLGLPSGLLPSGSNPGIKLSL